MQNRERRSKEQVRHWLHRLGQPRLALPSLEVVRAQDGYISCPGLKTAPHPRNGWAIYLHGTSRGIDEFFWMERALNQGFSACIGDRVGIIAVA